MAEPDDDYERLLREVDQALSGKPAPPPRAEAKGEPAKPSSSVERASGGSTGSAGPLARMEAGLPVALATGAVSGGAVFVVFAVLPFVSSVSGGIGAFLAGTAVSLLGRLRR
jgi:hypothetical protein